MFVFFTSKAYQKSKRNDNCQLLYNIPFYLKFRTWLVFRTVVDNKDKN